MRAAGKMQAMPAAMLLPKAIQLRRCRNDIKEYADRLPCDVCGNLCNKSGGSVVGTQEDHEQIHTVVFILYTVQRVGGDGVPGDIVFHGKPVVGHCGHGRGAHPLLLQARAFGGVGSEHCGSFHRGTTDKLHSIAKSRGKASALVF